MGAIRDKKCFGYARPNVIVSVTFFVLFSIFTKRITIIYFTYKIVHIKTVGHSTLVPLRVGLKINVSKTKYMANIDPFCKLAPNKRKK